MSSVNPAVTPATASAPATEKELRIVGFLCNWCSYGGADSAGTARATQPTDLRIIRVPCSGRVNPLFILKALLDGADGVLVSGCHPRDCHYTSGNFYARRRLEMLKEFLPILGIDPRRFMYTWVSASEGQRWKDVVTSFTATIHELGPAPKWDDIPATYDFAPALLDSWRTLGLGENPHLADLRTAMKETLATTEGLQGILAWKLGYDPLHTEAVLMKTPEEIDSALWGPFNVQNLANFLPLYKGKKVGIVVKGCDSKSIVELLAENLINREDVVIFGMGCNGTVEVSRVLEKLPVTAKILSARGHGATLDVEYSALGQTATQSFKMAEIAQDKCRQCLHPNALISDTFVGNPVTVPQAGEPGAPDMSDGRSGALRFLDALSLPERMAFWKGAMERCVRCYACRSACPMCVCRDYCISDSRDPHWLSQEDNVRQKLFFQLIHATHLAGRCTGCAECSRACPVGIPVFALKQQYGRMIKKVFGYAAGMDSAAVPPLQTYKVDEGWAE